MLLLLRSFVMKFVRDALFKSLFQDQTGVPSAKTWTRWSDFPIRGRL